VNEPRHLPWGANALWRQLVPLLPGLSVEVVASIDSTNTRLLERARALGGRRDAPISRPGELDGAEIQPTPHGRRQGDVQPCLLVAEQQTRGRGRLGRDWQSDIGASLTFSLSLPLSPREWSGLSLAVGVALADALDTAAADAAAASSPRLMLKWPNDLWLADGPGRGRKLGGVLIETVAVGERRMCVIGVGLNLLPQPGNPASGMASAGFSSGYACLKEIDASTSGPRALAAVALPLVKALKRFEREGFAPFAAAYAKRDLLVGQPVSTTLAELPAGVAEGVDEHGALRVRAGALHRLISGEVSVRLQNAPEDAPEPRDRPGAAAC
jgi:BirA family transcriptional regulator, biotin operon repressor / biotin---[acetyl-CoA-carboxylase] ligase